MARYILGRLGQALLVLWGTFTLAYVILFLLPGDSLAVMLAASGVDIGTLGPRELADARAHYGLDRGAVAQYFAYLGGVLQGDFGESIASRQPVVALLADRLPQTALLAGLAVSLSVLAGFGFAWLAAWVRRPVLRTILRRLPALGLSVPVFWTGLILIQVFAFWLGLLPSEGNVGWRSLVLPAVTLSIPSAMIYAQVLIRGFDDGWRQPWITTARAKGLRWSQIQARHVLRNASLPVLTLVGLQIGNTVSGAVLVETVFTRTGIGRLAQESVLRQDVPVVLAIVVISAAAFVTVNLVVDLAYPLLDPRIRHTPSSA